MENFISANGTVSKMKNQDTVGNTLRINPTSKGVSKIIKEAELVHLSVRLVCIRGNG
jgi:hypothetical protein